jgi:hypothetical protein
MLSLPAILASLLVGQAPVETRLRPPAVRLDQEFTRIVGLRELSGGRVLVTDAGEKRLVAIGARGAYVVSTDEDGIQRLQRHPWP